MTDGAGLPADRPRFTGRRLWLVVGVLALNLLLAAAAAMTVMVSRDRAVQQVRTLAANMADLVRRNLTDFGVRVDATLQGVIDDIDRDGSLDAARTRLQGHALRKFEQRLPKDSALVIVDESGRLLWPLEGDWAPSVPAGGAGTLRVSPPVLDPRSGRWKVACSRDLFGPGGARKATVVALIPVAHFEEMIAGIDAGPRGLLLLRDAERGLIAFNRPVSGPAGQIGSRRITPQAAALLDTGAEKASYDAPMSPDGVPRTYAFHWSRSMGMVVGVGLAPDDYLAAWRNEAAFAAGLVLVFLLITATGAWVIQRAWNQLDSDIGVHRRLHRELARSEGSLRQLIDESPLAIQVVTARGVVVSVNRAWERMWGVRLEALASYNMLEDPQLAQAGVLPMIRQVLAGGEPAAVVTRYDRGAIPTVHGPSGQVVVKTRIYGNRDEQGAVHEFVLIQEDVSKLQEAEDALRRHHEQLEETVERRTREILVQQTKLQNILDGIPGGVGFWDRELRNGFANGGYVEWLGLPRDRVLGHRLDEVLPPAQLQQARQMIERVFAGEAQQFESQRPGPEPGRVRHVRVHYVPDRQDGAVIGFFVLVFDITELVEAKRAAETASQAKSAFLANMSHEIRTPMNGMLGMTYLLRRSGVSPRQVDYLDKIESSGRHLLSIINDILDLSKIESGKAELEQRPFQLADVVRHVVGTVEEKARAKGLQLEVDVGSVPQALRGDSTRLAQALLNYLDNAVKFTEQGRVGLRCQVVRQSPSDVELRFEVSDSGIGLSPEQLARVFDAFEQADKSTTRRFGGTGLGLTIVRRIAEMMGGQAGAESESGAGSTFWFTAVLGRAVATRAVDADPAAVLEETIRREHGGRRVLVVEDDPVSGEVVTDMFEAAGLDVTVAEDGAAAVAAAARGDFALILMDMRMPGIDGVEASKAIRRMPAHAHTPIVAMTANVFAEDRERCMAAGMDDFVSKPFEPQRLYLTVQHWLARKPSPPAS